MATVKWKGGKRTYFLGRNGYFKCSGLQVTDLGKLSTRECPVVEIQAITGKGKAGRCWLEVPRADLPALVSALENIVLGDKLGSH